MRNLLTYGSVIALIFFLTALDAAFFPALGYYSNFINITLMVSIYLLVIVRRDFALFIYAITTTLTSLYTVSWLFVPVLLGIGVLLFIDILFESFFTNRSYYTLLLLGLIAWFVYYAVFALIVTITLLFSPESIVPTIHFSWLKGVLTGAIVLIISLTILFLLTHFLSKKFKSYFIIND